MTIGIGIPRADGAAKVTGQALYVDDLRPDGCLYGATVRSARAHARILAIDLDPAYDWAGITVVTAKDIPGRNLVALITDDQPALADGLVRHVTEPIALVAAPTRDRALEAVKHVRVTYEDLPANLDLLAAEGHPVRIYGDDNVFKRITIDKGAPAGTVAGHVHEGVYRVGLQEQLYIEPQGMIAIPREDGGITVIGSMQCPYYIHKALKALLGHDRVNAVQAATGGGFGGKEEYPSMVAAHATLLALKAGKPVKLVYRRDEDLRATTKRHPAWFSIRSVVAGDGTLLEWTAKTVFDGGAYNTLSPVVLSRGLLHLTGPYRCENVHLAGVAVATHTPPNGAFRGFGAPQAQFAAERHMDRIARELGIDPLTLRRRNLLRDGDTTASGGRLVDTGAFTVLEAALSAAGAPLAPIVHPPGVGAARYLRGRGLSMVFHGCGFTGNGEAYIKGKVALDLIGNRVRILTASTDIGQGTETIFPQIVAAELGIPLASVEMAPHDTAIVPDSGPTVASRTTMVVGGVTQIAARRLREALQAETGLGTSDFASLLAARPSQVPLRVEHQYVDDGSVQWDPDRYVGDAYPTYGWACNIVDLDVDADTGEVLYRRFVGATDVGRAINPVLATGQLEGGVVQALGWATAEEVVLDARGCMRNDRLTNYIIPTAADAPEMVTVLVEIPFAGGPFGAKGIGEIPMDGPAAAVAQAVESACGAVLDRLPMTPERVLEAMS
jgi:CO/xanthine dehydrogenase Mo-binding subunit